MNNFLEFLALFSHFTFLKLKRHSMKKIFTCLITLFTIISTQAHTYYFDPYSYENSCCDNVDLFYGEIFGGANFIQTASYHHKKIDYNPGFVVAGTLGFHWLYGIRFEGEYAFRRNDAKKLHFQGESLSLKGHFQSSSYMANILWDLPLGCLGWNLPRVQTFLGAGAGYDAQRIHIKNNAFTFNKKENDFAWQVMAGVNYTIWYNTSISLEYKFHKGGLDNLYNHSLGIGLTYTFDLGIWRQQH